MRRAALSTVALLALVVVPPAVAAREQASRVALDRTVTAEPRARPACTIRGTRGADRLRGTDGPDVICALGGDDRVRARDGDDVLVLGPGDDAFRAGPGDDLVLAGSGNDFGNGGGGDDRIFLRRGSDITEDWQGVDLVAGGAGDDAMCVYDHDPAAPSDRVRGGPGPDYVGADAGDVVRSVKIVFYGGCWD